MRNPSGDNRQPLFSSAGLRGDFLDDKVVPRADSPLRGWRAVGAARLNKELWPLEAWCNPVVAYLAGRRRDAIWDDLFGIVPWVVLTAANVAAVFLLRGNPAWLIVIGAAEWALVPLLAAVLSAICVGSHARGTLRGATLEEFMATPLTPAMLAQGLSVRPMAVQECARLGFYFAMILLTAWSGVTDCGVLLLVCFWLLALDIPLSGANEIGGALALRAHLCIRDPQAATMRVLRGLGVLAAQLGAIGLAGWLLYVLLGPCFGVIVIGLMLLVMNVRQRVRDRARDAFAFCIEHPEEWWLDKDG